MGWEADAARDHAESMSAAERAAAEQECADYERDRRDTDDYRWSEEAHTSLDDEGDVDDYGADGFDEHAARTDTTGLYDEHEKEFRNGPPSVSKLRGYFDDVKPGAMSGDWRKHDPIGAILYDMGTAAQEKGMTPEEWFLDEVSHADKLYPTDFNRWYFLNVEQYGKGEPQHGDRDYRKKEAYTRWKTQQFKNLYGSQMTEGMPDEAYDDGNGMIIGMDPGNPTFVQRFKLTGSPTGRIRTDGPPVQWAVGKKKEQRKVSKKEELEQSLKVLRQRLEEIHKQYETILERPDEPQAGFLYREMEDTDAVRIPPAVYFKKQFTDNSWQAGKGYDYVFMKAGNGFWYGTGPHAPQKLTWDALLDWIDGTGPWPIIYDLTAHDGVTGVYWRPRQKDTGE